MTASWYFTFMIHASAKGEMTMDYRGRRNFFQILELPENRYLVSIMSNLGGNKMQEEFNYIGDAINFANYEAKKRNGNETVQFSIKDGKLYMDD